MRCCWLLLKAARNIDAYLRGAAYAPGPRNELATFERLNTWYYTDAEQTVQPVLDDLRRRTTFQEVVAGLDESNALFEARRCLSCGNCFECDNCYGICPDNAITKLGPGKRFEFKYDYCKGCAMCATECPCGAITMVAEQICKKLFGKDDDPAKKIEELIEQDNPGISNLKVDYSDGTVALSGKAASAEAMEKAVWMAGNVKGVSNVEVDDLESPAVTAAVDYYTIVKGDTLSGIAKRFYGNAMDYPKTFEANRQVIKDPDLIYPGQKIRIPAKG